MDQKKEVFLSLSGTQSSIVVNSIDKKINLTDLMKEVGVNYQNLHKNIKILERLKVVKKQNFPKGRKVYLEILEPYKSSFRNYLKNLKKIKKRSLALYLLFILEEKNVNGKFVHVKKQEMEDLRLNEDIVRAAEELGLLKVTYSVTSKGKKFVKEFYSNEERKKKK